MMETKDWKTIKDEVYGEKGTSRRDELDRDFESFKIGLMLRKAREEKNLTQDQLAEKIDKKRTYISRVENNGSNLTLKTLYDIVEKGLGGKVKISIEMEK
ncbi:helix-turn-helix transcriptional regulator [Salinimicrobium sp. ASW11-47]|nr:helix-turn-helix transcriptional regulator [Salinimicrobium sediminilitoris]MCC8358814.1 helix-turn-helix transcriptional regulator [Salinimicrobium sediminilitoris]